MTNHLTIPTVRATIDDADDILLRALGARFRAIRHLRDMKREAGMSVESPSREQELKTTWKTKAHELNIPPELALLVLDFILTESKRIQST